MAGRARQWLRRAGALAKSPGWLQPVLCGAAMALAQSPFSYWVLLLPALAALFALFAATASWRQAFLTGWLAGAGYFSLALSWIVQPFLVDAARHGWMAPFALVFMAGGLALFWGLAFAAARRICGAGIGGALCLAGCWTLADYLRSTIFTGFPWALVSYGWIETPVAQNASWAGPHGLALLTLAICLVLGTRRLPAVLASLALLAGLWGWGLWRMPQAAPLRSDAFTVRLVQPNAGQSLKWDAGWVATYYQRQLDYSATKAEPQPDVVIWPETAVPFILSTSQGALGEIAAFARPSRVILGIRELQGAAGDEDLFNSLVLLDQSGAVTARYDKHHLVPFGEYVPFAKWLGGIGIGPLTAENLFGFSAGSGPALISAPALPPFLPLICYEAIFPAAMQVPGARAEWLVQITNDAWFGRLTGPYQHLAQARMRAIEQGLPLARAANTGVSALVDPYGRITHALALGTAGFVDAPLPSPLPPTPYSRSGDWPALLLAALMAALPLALRRIRL